MAIGVGAAKPVEDESYDFTQEEETVLRYLESNPGASYREITGKLEADPQLDYNFTDIQDGVESLKSREEEFVERVTEGRMEYFELGEAGKELLE